MYDCMYGFSRAIYRELAPHIMAPPAGAPATGNHTAVLLASEHVITRLATDRHYFAHPSRTLFNDIRIYFPMTSQLRVLRVIQSRSPSLRYPVGTDAAWLPRLKSVLPWPLFAVGVRRTFAV